MAEFDKIKYNNQYNAKTYDRVNLVIPKGTKAVLQDHAKSQGKSLNAYIVGLVEKDIGGKLVGSME